MPRTILGFTGGLSCSTLLFQLLKDGREVEAVHIDLGQPATKKERVATALVLSVAKKRFDRVVPFREVRLQKLPPCRDDSSPISQFGGLIVSVLATFATGSKEVSLACAGRVDTTPFGFDLAANHLLQSAWPNAQMGLFWPFASKTQAEVLEVAEGLGVPISLCWSCFEGGADHCGRCRGCRARKFGFMGSRRPDRTRYRA
jgi:7-cyano-7-deazaguanine synthase in queuosine biosynthesis